MKSELVRATNHLNDTGRCNGWIEQPEEIQSGIYCWTCTENGKIYVGQSVNLKNRKKAFLSFQSTFHYGGDYINKARKHYNQPSQWSYSILEYCNTDVLDEREIKYIAQSGASNRNKGYNTSIGGGGCRGMKQTQDSIQRRADANKRVVLQLDPDTLEVVHEWDGMIDAAQSLGLKSTSSIIKCCNGQFYQAAGFKWCYKGEIDRIKKGYFVRPFRSLLQVDKFDDIVIKEWNSFKEVSSNFNVTLSQVYECANGQVKTAGGYRWCYADKGITPEWSKQTRPTRCKRVMQIDPDTNEILHTYDSAAEAARAVGGQTYSSILKCCNGSKFFNKAYGFKWAYEGTELNEEWIKSTTDVTPKRIEQIDPKTGEVLKVWDMIKEAAQYYNVTESCIGECCRGRQKSSAGYMWRYEDESLRVEFIPKPSRKKPVLQFDMSGNFLREWESATDVAKEFGCNRAAILNCCQGKVNSSMGYKWKFK